MLGLGTLVVVVVVVVLMDLVHGNKASKFVAEGDVISSLPENVITNILDRLPIRDAVRTGILARNWRFKWTMLSQLVFDEKFFKNLLGDQSTNSYDWRNVMKFLLHLKGSIVKFTLLLPKHMVFDVEDINHWFLFLSGKGIEDVILINVHQTPLKLPNHLFSCLELKHLKIRNCYFCPPLSFRGFPKLLKLKLLLVHFESYKFGELVTCCPLLEILIIHCYNGLFRKVKPVEITILENLKTLSMLLSNLDTRTLTSSSIFQLVGSFSKLQSVCLGFQSCKLVAEAGARKGVTTTFPCLKTLRLWFIDCNKDIEVSFVLKMICCSPKLLRLNIAGTYENDVPPVHCSSDLDDNTMWQSPLQSVVFPCSKGSKSEVYLIKSLLACSSLLKKIAIGLNSSLVVGGADGKLQFAEKLLKLHRASPVAEIDLSYYSNWDSSTLAYYLL